MKIFKLDIKTLDILNRYNSYRDASESVGCSHNLIREACVGIHKGRNAKGYKWFAMDELTGLNHYDFRKNKDGTNLSLDNIKEILNIEKETTYSPILVRYMDYVIKEMDDISLREMEQIKESTINFLYKITEEVEKRK